MTHVEDRGKAVFIVSDAGVDHDPAIAGPDGERLKRKNDLAIGCGMQRLQPFMPLHDFGRAIWKHELGVDLLTEYFDDAEHFHVPDNPSPDMLLRHDLAS